MGKFDCWGRVVGGGGGGGEGDWTVGSHKNINILRVDSIHGQAHRMCPRSQAVHVFNISCVMARVCTTTMDDDRKEFVDSATLYRFRLTVW